MDEIHELIKKYSYQKIMNDAHLSKQIRMFVDKNTEISSDGLSIGECIYIIKNGLTMRPTCVCGSNLKYEHGKYRDFCSTSCSANSNIVKLKKEQNLMAKYGVSNVSKMDAIKEKKRTTSIKNFGQTSYMKTEIGKEKNKETNRRKYGVENPFQIERVKVKNRERWVENREKIISKRTATHKSIFLSKVDARGKELGYHRLFSDDDYVGCDRTNKYKFLCTKCNRQFLHHMDDGAIPLCPNCNPSLISRGTSNVEDEIFKFITAHYDGLVIRNDRSIIAPFELDMVIPDKKIAFELNGIYWHSQLSGGKDENYHIEKTTRAIRAGYRVVHIFEDEWLFHRRMVCGRISHILGATKRRIYARRCKIFEIDNNTKNKFLDKYHLQGSDSSSIRLGAFYKNRLVAVMTFCRNRYDSLGGMELLRYATISNFSCVGVAGKLLSHFEKVYNPTRIKTYADLRWSDGNLYKCLGFKHIHNSKPNCFYTKDHIVRVNRMGFQKHKLKNKLEKFDNSLSEWNNMKMNGWDRIWDCGNMVFEKTYQQQG